MQTSDASDNPSTELDDAKLQLLKLTLAQAMGRIAELDQIGRVFHDFNNILSSSMGYASLAGERAADLGDEKLSRYLANIEKAGIRSRDLVRECLDKRQQYRDQQSCELRVVLEVGMQLLGRSDWRANFADNYTLNIAHEPAGLILSSLGSAVSADAVPVFDARLEEEPQCAGCGSDLRGSQLHLHIKGLMVSDDSFAPLKLASVERDLAASSAAAYGGHLCESLLQDREIVVYLKASAT